MTTYQTTSDLTPRISHNHDLILRDGQVEQSYNFLDYEFMTSAGAIRARYYLDTPEVYVNSFAGSVPRDALAASKAVPSDVLCYLQKRFLVIQALTAEGYKVIWRLRP